MSADESVSEIVYILGAVNNPGSVDYGLIESEKQPEMFLLLAEAGGFSKYAKRGEVFLIRNGKVLGTRDLDIAKLLTSGVKDFSGQDYSLLPGDVVFVAERGLDSSRRRKPQD
jgi:protein involved in polysaccharide export with SLBB domain